MGSPRSIATWLALVCDRFPDAVETAADRIADRERVTFAWPARIAGILRPADATQVAALCRLASEAGVRLHPISRGRNVGLGSALPFEDAVLLDLGRLDRIVALDVATGVARIEPGVTFETLQNALAEAGLDHHLPAFGGPRDASVLANALARGEAGTALGDRFGSLHDLEVVLTTGERLHTGHGRFGPGPLPLLHGRPAGPLLDGLFSQSGFGIVVAGTIALMPTPTHATCVVARPHDDGAAAIEALCARLRSLIADGVVPAHDVFVWDAAKRASSALTGVWPPEGLAPYRVGLGLLAAVTIAGRHESLVAERIRITHDELGGAVAEAADHDLLAGVSACDPVAIRGFSRGANVASAYAGKDRLPADLDFDPDRDRCGFLWICPVVPFTGVAIELIGRLADEATIGLPLYPALGLQAVSPRALHTYLSLAWNRDAPGADAAAAAAHDRIVATLEAQGLHPYRVAHPTPALTTPPVDDWAAVTARLRDALDPTHTLTTRPTWG